MALARNCGVALGACGAVLSATARPRVAAVYIAVAHWLAAPSAFTAWAHNRLVLPLAPSLALALVLALAQDAAPPDSALVMGRESWQLQRDRCVAPR